MILTSEKQKNEYRDICKISLDIFGEIKNKLKVGILPIELDNYAGEICSANKIVPAFQKVKNQRQDFGHNTCISVNDIAVHGVPSTETPIAEGDLVSIDFGIHKNNLFTDHCFTFGIGSISPTRRKILNVAKSAVENAVAKSISGNTTGDLGFAMQSTASSSGFDVIKEYIGHGIGKGLHEHPDIPAFGIKNQGAELEEGMVICVECQVVAGSDEVHVLDDGWSVATIDGGASAMFEYMVLVGKDSAEVLTDNRDWSTII